MSEPNVHTRDPFIFLLKGWISSEGFDVFYKQNIDVFALAELSGLTNNL